MPTEMLAGRSVRVMRRGDDTARTLMIHCSLARSEALLPLQDALDRPAILFDMPGHGGSADWDEQGDYQVATARIGAELAPTPMHVIGHSFGATVALRMAIDHPESVARLTLIEPVFFAVAAGTEAYDHHRAEFAPFVAAMEAGDRKLAASVFHGLWGQGPWDDLPRRVQDDLAAHIHLIPAGAAAIEDDRDGVIPRLSEVSVPVTLIRGGDSPTVIAAIHSGLQDAMPQATDHVIAGAGHMVALTHAKAVAGIIRGADPENRR